MAERKVWTQNEDQTLKMLVQSRNIKKWSQISQILATQFRIAHRNGKQCRQRYLNHLALGLKKGDWSREEEQNLITLHNRYGNKWAQISRHFQGRYIQKQERTDNCVKNQLYSRLRRSLRYLNDAIQTKFKKRFKLLKINFIYKLIEMADEKYKSRPAIKKEAFEDSYQLKNQILNLQCGEGEIDEEKVVALISQINKFNKAYKKRIPKKKVQKKIKNITENLSQEESNSDQVESVIQSSYLPESALKRQKMSMREEEPIKITITQPIMQLQKREQQKSLFGENCPTSNEKLQLKVLKKDSNESSISRKIDRLHSLSIEKESAFQTIINQMSTNGIQEESFKPCAWFRRVDPMVHGEENQNKSKMKYKNSSSNEDFPKILLEGQICQPKTERLKSFGSIEALYEAQQKSALNRASSFDQQFNKKEEEEYWLSNIQ